eukprot:CAMPEP_0184871536 /NCGR_PEP_ID=MMETSP0580-20130426/40775_1 /TAXON_ID=1118495 /ORGANISM="Dactyliosolen fragilissimus" /LENGTH=303 /DNA_ID=CAMNT_0027374207 /DNA_START=22 /DNA_END=933 /DNA_ORIENTATION=-
MPPNVKEVSTTIISLDLSDHVLPSKYTPLTSTPNESERNEVKLTITPKESYRLECNSNEQVATQAGHSYDSSSYWSWEETSSPASEKELILSKILEEEKARIAVSTSNIIKNLTSNQKRAISEIIENEEKVDDGYWDEEYNSNPYWEWEQASHKTSEKERIISRILEEEDARIAASTCNIIANITSNQQISTSASEIIENEERVDESYWDEEIINEEKLQVLSLPNAIVDRELNSIIRDQYWNFTSAPCTHEVKKENLIKEILLFLRILIMLLTLLMARSLMKKNYKYFLCQMLLWVENLILI